MAITVDFGEISVRQADVLAMIGLDVMALVARSTEWDERLLDEVVNLLATRSSEAGLPDLMDSGAWDRLMERRGRAAA